MIRSDLFLCGILEVLQARSHLTEVDVTKSTVEQDLARVETKFQTQLLIVDKRIATKVKQGIVEIGQGFFEIPQKEIGYAFLEVGNGEVLV